ncbi:glycosyltransferase family 87 protein [Corynebacterium pygosceleis]|uniref:glycosyltransferase family 87 protein n=1 Tax=Corynebacterium pygosceleis TaxID=2800406 RepID=UPI0020048E0F|nr:glycosyltransferase 87 family protein [Corynebacterium pygosceleis]MCK7676092.1 glycosyltransferase 87 family protein [Corynebacterium pygosceleis]
MSEHRTTRSSTGTRRDTARIQPAHDEPLARDFTAFLGGPMGRFTAPGTARLLTPLRVLICVGLVFLALGWLSKANCISGTAGDDGVFTIDWSGSRQFLSACYTDIVPLYGNTGLSEGHAPYAHSWTDSDGSRRYTQYPVLASLVQWVTALVARSVAPLVAATGLPVPAAAVYFSLTAAVLALFWILVVRSMVSLTGNRVWDTLLVAASPLIAVHAFTDYDILAVAAAVGALLAAARRKPVAAGVLIGLGAAVKLWPLLLLGGYLVLAVRHHRFRPFLTMTGTAVVTWLVVNLPVMLTFPDGWREFLRVGVNRAADWDTVYSVVQRSTGWSGWDHGGTPTVLNTVSGVLFVVACILIGVFAVRTRRTPRVAEIVFLIVAVFLLVNKVWSPQHSLWLVPLIVLALPKWRIVIAWMLSEALLWPVRMWFMAGEDALGAPAGLHGAVVLVRGALVIALVVLVVRQMRGRSVDPVLTAHDGVDPLAGDFIPDGDTGSVTGSTTVSGEPADAAAVSGTVSGKGGSARG